MSGSERLLGIDPGSLATGWGLVSGRASRPVLIDCGIIRLAASAPLVARLAELQRQLERLLVTLRPDSAGVESPFHGASARSALQLAHARGVVLAALGRHGIEVCEYSPASVKKSVTGNGRADKAQVGHMVRRLLDPARLPRSHDVQDALAVALCHMSTSGHTAAVQRAHSADPPP